MDVKKLRFLKLLLVRNDNAILQIKSIINKLFLSLLTGKLGDHCLYSIVQKASRVIGVHESLGVEQALLGLP